MKKIIVIVAVIATITACFCVSTNAVNGLSLNDSDIIVFKDEITYFNDTYALNFKTTFGGTTYDLTGIKTTKFGNDYVLNYNPQGSNFYSFTTNEWLVTGAKTIVISGDQYITNESFINWLYDNTESGLPERQIEKTLDNTKTMFATTLTIASAIIAWLLANQIALVGLYLYILIALVATGKRFIKGA